MVAAGGKIFASTLNEVIGASSERPMCIVRRLSGEYPLSIANNGAVVSWTTETLDTHGWHSTSVNTSRITPLKSGWIRFTFCVTYSNITAGRYSAAVRVNGSTTYYGVTGNAGGGNLTALVSVDLQMNGSTDYAEAFAYHTKGSANDIIDPNSTFFSAEWLRND